MRRASCASNSLQVDRPGLREGLQDRVAGDLGERDALGLRGVDPQQRGHVERDGLALAVVVRREDDVVGPLQHLLQLADVPLGILRHHVVRT